MQPTTFYSLALLATAAGLIGFIAHTQLFTPGKILNGYFNWLSRAVGPEAKLHGRKRRDWLYNPLGYCLACFSGQLALWGYVLSLPRTVDLLLSTPSRRGAELLGIQPLTLHLMLPAFHPGHAAFTICAAIFVATQLNARAKINN